MPYISLSNRPCMNARLNPDLNDMNDESIAQKKGLFSEVMSKPIEKPSTILDNNTPTPATAHTVPSPSFPSSSSSSTYHKQIYDLIDNLDTKANDHNKRLEDCKKEDKDSKKKLKEKKKQEKQEIKEKMEALLQPKDPNDTSKQSIIRLPLWKHKLQGQRKPPPEQVIKGKVLFKLIAISIIGLIVHPQLVIKKRKLQFYDHNKRKFAQTLQIILGSMEEWMAKTVQLPITSIVTVSLIIMMMIVMIIFPLLYRILL